MILLSIGSDKNVFDVESGVRKRLISQASVFDEIHIVVVSKNLKYIKKGEVVNNNIFLYPVYSRFKPILFLKGIKTLFTVGRIIKKNKKEFYISSQDPFEMGLISLIVAKYLRCRIQFQFHTDCFNILYIKHGLSNYMRFIMARMMIGFVDSVRVVSERIKKSILALYPKMSVIHVLPVFINLKSLRDKGVVEENNLRNRFSNFQKIVLVVARLESEKNIDLAIKSFSKMLRFNPNLGLVIAGSGSRMSWLKDYARYLGLSDRVKFLGWQMDTVSLFKTSDILLVTSLYEGFGMTIVEAIASGLPVVSTDVGIAREVGAVVVSYDPGEIALKALNVLQGNVKIEPKIQEMPEEVYLNKFMETFN